MHHLRNMALHNKPATLLRVVIGVLCVTAFAGNVSAATLTVGPGKSHAKPCSAIAAAKDGDIIEIAGKTTYSGDVCAVYANNLTIRGVNGRPKIDAAGASFNGKGTWVVVGNNLTVENIEMAGAKAASLAGAALRLDGTHFTLRSSYIHDNQNGILASANTKSNVLVEYTEFSRNGHGNGKSHNLDVGNVNSLTFRYSYSHDANAGHNLKSRARTNTIVYNRFSGTGLGAPGYEIDLPNAGTSYVIGNVIEQPAANANPTILAYGEEGASNPGKNLYVVNNTFLNNDGSGGTFVMVGAGVTTPVLLQNNIFAGVGLATNQGNAIDKTNYRAAAPAFVNRAASDLHPASTFMINAGSAPGTAPTGVSLVPSAQYKAVASGEARPVVGALDIGAYEAVSAAKTTAATVTWTRCATEGGTCNISGTYQVRFGANEKFVTRTVTGPVACTRAVFGDPVSGVVKSCSYVAVPTSTTGTTGTAAKSLATAQSVAAANWTVCAVEGATCNITGTRQVRFGTATTYVTKTVTGPVACTSAVFGDPAPGVMKACRYDAAAVTAPATTPTATATTTTTATATPADTATWTVCAVEGATCNIAGTYQVRYGTSTTYVTKTVTGPVACGNAVFGDPAPGVMKACRYDATAPAAVTAPATTPDANATWTACAVEGGTCNITGTHQVRFGAYGNYVIRTVTGPVACTRQVFSDPAPRLFKECSYVN